MAGKKAHAFARSTGPCSRIMASTGKTGEEAVAGQDVVENLSSEWLPLWQRQDRSLDPVQLNDEGPELPPITVEELDQTLECYPEQTGKGNDGVNPRSWFYLPRPTKLKLIELMHSFELRPAAFWELLTLMCFIQKATGGSRPIALTCAFVRIWSRLRSKIAREWELSCADPFFWEGQTSLAKVRLTYIT